MSGNRLGRTAGVPNRTTTDLRQLRAEIASAYYTCGGREIMERLAAENPQAFIKAVVSCLPKEDRLELTSTQRTLTVVLSKEPDPDKILDLIQCCLSIADGQAVTREVVIEAMGQRKER